MSRITHNKSSSRAYNSWCSMKQRCHNPSNKFYPWYGARGITVCPNWRFSFEQFFADMRERPENYTIERIDNEKGYSKENCRWATRSDQQKNRRCNRFITFEGTTKTAMEWSEEKGIAHQTIYNRMDLGWEAEKILKPEKQIIKDGLKFGGAANGIRQRAKTHCKSGHLFDEANTLWYRNNRSCRTCHRIRQAARYAAKTKK